MKLYNTLTKQIDELKPLKPPAVTIYTCGPTVYDYAHVGHWFTYVRSDILIRALKANGLKPQWIMNITDVGHLVSDADEGEDKLEKGAKREGKTAWEVAEFYAKDFKDCLKLLNITQPDEMPKATDHIQEQIELIQVLDSKGYTYQIDDGVYYDTSKFSSYADFARLDLDEQQAGARVTFNPQKRNPSDFALWKFSPGGQKRDMEWDSPWGKGFPGWHIECSAMSMKYLGETLDIHTGGIDHVPVHHANEIAQSTAATGKPFANYWLHTNHVLIDGQKISKSLDNGIRLQEVIKKGISPEAFRLHVLESHYRSQSKFSWDSLVAAQNRLQDLRAMAALRWQPLDHTNNPTTFAIEDVSVQITDMLSDDLNTPEIMAFLSTVSTQLQVILLSKERLDAFVKMLGQIDEMLGLKLSQVSDISDDNKSLISMREAARKSHDWQKSDQLRDQLLKNGLGLRDMPQGVIWFPV
jgi:cysteinyl-tRNA synthetase